MDTCTIQPQARSAGGWPQPSYGEVVSSVFANVPFHNIHLVVIIEIFQTPPEMSWVRTSQNRCLE